MLANDKSIDIYKAIKASNKERVFENWHASSIAECPRAHYYKRLHIPVLSDASASKMIRWGAGHLLEEYIRPHVQAVYGDTKSNQRYTSEKLNLTGEFDNLTVKDNRLIEIKSVHDMAFVDKNGISGLKENIGTSVNRYGKESNVWGIKETPYLHHELQNHCYVLLLAEQGIKVTGIDYVYITLSGRLAVYQTEVQEEMLDNVRSRLKMLNEAWETKTPPPCICNPEHKLYAPVMQYCDYKTEQDCCSLKLIKETK